MPQKTNSMLLSNSSAPTHVIPTGECPPVAEGLNTIAIKAQSLHALLQFMGLERQSFQTLSDSLQDAYVHQAKDLAREIATLAEGVSR